MGKNESIINELIEIISAKGDLKAYVHSFGCQLNVSDGEKIKGVLKKIGYSFTFSFTNSIFVAVTFIIRN